MPASGRRTWIQGDVVYTRDTHNGNYLQTRRGSSFRWSIACRGPQVGRLCPEVRDAGKGKTVAVIDKPTFGSVALCDFVEAGGYTAVELVGLCTDICVISNCPLSESTIVGDSNFCSGFLLRRCYAGKPRKCPCRHEDVSNPSGVTGVREETVVEKEILLFGGLLLDHYFSVDRWPQRGQDGYVVGQARFVGGVPPIWQ